MEIILILTAAVWYLLCAVAILTLVGYVMAKEEAEGCFCLLFVFGMSFLWPIALPLWVIISCILRLIDRDWHG